jgi:hypothetical protein
MVKPLLLLCCGLLCSVVLFGQNFRKDTLFLAEAKRNAINSYSTAIGGQSHLYNGSAYSEYVSQRDEHPYFLDEWVEGSVTYDGEFHDNVPILYDLSQDRVIIDNAFSVKKVMLVNEKVSAFTIGERRFVHIVSGPLAPGHYELAYDGDVKVYGHYKKAMQSKVVDYSIFNEFEEKRLYYIFKDGKFTSVRSKGSVVKVFGDKKKEIKKFIRDNKLAFGSDRVRDMSRIAQYYDQIK